ncbi:receptor-like protein kinase 5 [Ipomoea triloba]|uniref:receptor-like protein kinase 5 n=2 Tax=Ipomoea triloba TaxID=35885 RepID=UPI00125D2589|nr:receptor-like protein kinase 5 [Ipomoea triloba]
MKTIRDEFKAKISQEWRVKTIASSTENWSKGLSYMHHNCSPPIVHRDVKSSNVLLDSEFNAKIADFGLARMLMKQGDPNTMSTFAGTCGYIAPEYVKTRKVNEKIDVYNFGVILLELVTGRESNDGDMDWCLADWAQYYVVEENPIEDALDEEIKEAENIDVMCGVFKLGIFCTGKTPAQRPTMGEALRILQHPSPLSPYGKEISVSERDVLPLIKCSSSEGILEDEDHCLEIQDRNCEILDFRQ